MRCAAAAAASVAGRNGEGVTESEDRLIRTEGESQREREKGGESANNTYTNGVCIPHCLSQWRL